MQRNEEEEKGIKKETTKTKRKNIKVIKDGKAINMHMREFTT